MSTLQDTTFNSLSSRQTFKTSKNFNSLAKDAEVRSLCITEVYT